MTLTGAPLLVLLALGSLALLAMVVALRRLRRRVAAALGLVLVLSLTWGASENDQFGYYRSWAALLGRDPQPDLVPSLHLHLAHTKPLGGFAWSQALAGRKPGTHGVLLAVDFDGARSGLDRSGYVYLPPLYLAPGYAEASFPVLELISGSPGAPPNWVHQLDIAHQMDQLIAARKVGQMILVIPAPNGHLSQSQECVDAVRGPQDDTYLTRDVRDDVLASFRASPDRRNWGVAGYSTGGFCAVNLLTRHTDLFSAAASMDGYFHALNDRYTGDLYHGNAALRLANSPDWVWVHQPPTTPVHLLLLAGAGDVGASNAAIQFHDELASEPPLIRYGDTVEVGIHAKSRHSFIAWRADMPTVLGWAWRQLSTSATPRVPPTTSPPPTSPAESSPPPTIVPPRNPPPSSLPSGAPRPLTDCPVPFLPTACP